MKLTDNVFGAIFMAVSMLSFIGNDALMKFLFQTISVEQGIFMRGLVSVPLLAMIAYFRKSLFIRIDWRNWRVILVRAFAELASVSKSAEGSHVGDHLGLEGRLGRGIGRSGRGIGRRAGSLGRAVEAELNVKYILSVVLDLGIETRRTEKLTMPTARVRI